MSELVTLELPDSIAQYARETAAHTGRSIEQVLTEWIGRAAANEDSTLLIPGAEYPIYTPYGNEAAAQILLEVLNQANELDRKTKKDQ